MRNGSRWQTWAVAALLLEAVDCFAGASDSFSHIATNGLSEGASRAQVEEVVATPKITSLLTTLGVHGAYARRMAMLLMPPAEGRLPAKPEELADMGKRVFGYLQRMKRPPKDSIQVIELAAKDTSAQPQERKALEQLARELNTLDRQEKLEKWRQPTEPLL